MSFHAAFGPPPGSAPLAAIADQLSLIVHASVARPTATAADDASARGDFATENTAYKKLRSAVIRCLGGEEAAAACGVAVRSVVPLSISHTLAPTPSVGVEEGQQGAVGEKAPRRDTAGSPPAFPTVARDGYATVALVVSCHPPPQSAVVCALQPSAAAILAKVAEALRAVRTHQLITMAMERNGSAAAVAANTSSSDTPAAPSRILVESVGYLASPLAEDLPERSFASVRRPKGAEGGAAAKGGLRTEGGSASTAATVASPTDSGPAAALEDLMCAVLIEGFLDSVPIAAGPTAAVPSQAPQERLASLVAMTMRDTVPMLEAYMKQMYGARVALLHPSSARAAFLAGGSSSSPSDAAAASSSEAPLGSVAIASSERLAAAMADPSAVVADFANNPFTAHCFFDFGATTVLPMVALATAQPDGGSSAAGPALPTGRVTAHGRLYFAFLPSHPQAEQCAAHLRTTMHAQRVFNGHPIRVNTLTGKQFVRALRGIKEVYGQ